MFNHVKHEFPTLLQENLDGSRVYKTPTGEKYPSVTTVLADYNKEGIMEWRKRVGEAKANKISAAATSRGTSVHKALESFLKNEDMSNLDMMPDSKNMFFRMRDEVASSINNVHCLETKMFSHELKIAGTVDCIAEHNGEVAVIDFKTANRMKKKENIENYFMQTAAYAKMFTEHTGIEIKKLVILIGVEGLTFCQKLIAKPIEIPIYEEKLLQMIDRYYEKTSFGVSKNVFV